MGDVVPHPPRQVSEDWTSASAELQAAMDAIVRYSWEIRCSGRGFDPESYSLDIVEAVLVDRLREEPTEARRAIALCFVLALKHIAAGG